MKSRQEYQADQTVHKKHSFIRVLIRILSWFAVLIGVFIATGVGIAAHYAKTAPVITQEALEGSGASTFYDSGGKVLLELGDHKRKYVKDSDIPLALKYAVISIEDKRFYQEKLGVDPVRIAGALIANLRSKSIAEGGSTITQQLVKLTVFSTQKSDQTIKRKIQEAWLAVQLSQRYSKDRILEYYINKVFMNYGCYGIGTASDYYYGKPLKQLNLPQIAVLAGMPNAPAVYDPYRNPEATKKRRDLVLKSMYDNDMISERTLIEAVNTPVTYGLVTRHKETASTRRRTIDDAYLKEAIAEVQKAGYNPYSDNLQIYLNIDQKAQNHLYDIANNGKVPFASNKMQVGASVIDPKSGSVIAMLGGRKLPKVVFGLNRAVQTTRSSGSSIKPILDYAPAIEYKNWGTNHTLADTPYTYAGTHIQLYDFDNAYLGYITMRYALEQSRNVPAVRALQEVGLKKARDFVSKMGINISSRAGLSVGIGADVSSLQLAGAYAALANGGIYYRPSYVSRIVFRNGQERYLSSPGKRVMKDSTAFMITDMLKGVISRGSGTSAQIKDLHQAGKTGTVKYSDDELARYPSYANTPKDSWFVGYTKDYVMSVWTGYDNISEGTIRGAGEDTAQLLYKNQMQYLMKNKKNTDWKKPSSVTAVSSEYFPKGHAPKVKKDTGRKQSSASGSSARTVQPRSSDSISNNSNSNYYYRIYQYSDGHREIRWYRNNPD